MVTDKVNIAYFMLFTAFCYYTTGMDSERHFSFIRFFPTVFPATRGFFPSTLFFQDSMRGKVGKGGFLGVTLQCLPNWEMRSLLLGLPVVEILQWMPLELYTLHHSCLNDLKSDIYIM